MAKKASNPYLHSLLHTICTTLWISVILEIRTGDNRLDLLGRKKCEETEPHDWSTFNVYAMQAIKNLLSIVQCIYLSNLLMLFTFFIPIQVGSAMTQVFRRSRDC